METVEGRILSRRERASIAFVWSGRRPVPPNTCVAGGARTHWTEEARPVKKTRKLSIRVTEEELGGIKAKAQQAGRGLTDYVVRTCLGKRLLAWPQLEEAVKELKAIGRNLNQLTALAHMGRVQAVGLTELTERLKDVNTALRALLELGR